MSKGKKIYKDKNILANNIYKSHRTERLKPLYSFGAAFSKSCFCARDFLNPAFLKAAFARGIF